MGLSTSHGNNYTGSIGLSVGPTGGEWRKLALGCQETPDSN